MPEVEALVLSKKRKEIVRKVKDYINDFLNLSKTNFLALPGMTLQKSNRYSKF